jgi:hypothetical protein
MRMRVAVHMLSLQPNSPPFLCTKPDYDRGLREGIAPAKSCRSMPTLAKRVHIPILNFQHCLATRLINPAFLAVSNGTGVTLTHTRNGQQLALPQPGVVCAGRSCGRALSGVHRGK